MSKRTKKQSDANRLDLELFRLAGKFERFSEDHEPITTRSRTGRQIAMKMFNLRHAIRAHMHKEDREDTQ